MKSNLLKYLGIFFIALVLVTGCGNEEKEIDTGNNQSNVSESESNKTDSKEVVIDNLSIENTISGYIKALQENNDSETAYKYIDFIGMTIWQELGITNNANLGEEKAKEIIEKYNSYINDSEKVDKINSYVKSVLNKEYYKKQNKELAERTNKYTSFEIERNTKVTDNIYLVKVKTYFTVNNTNSSSTQFYALMEIEGKYYFINSYAVYNHKDLSLGSLLK